MPRKEEGFDGEFNFIPIYGLIKFRSKNETNVPYLTTHLGYNIFEGDSIFKFDGSLENGMYYGLGGGITFDNDFVLELLYSVNKGKLSFKIPVYSYYGYTRYIDIETDVEYKTIRLNIGYKFSLGETTDEVVRRAEKVYDTDQPSSPIYCTWCGAKNKPDGRFCIKCGKKLIKQE